MVDAPEECQWKGFYSHPDVVLLLVKRLRKLPGEAILNKYHKNSTIYVKDRNVCQVTAFQLNTLILVTTEILSDSENKLILVSNYSSHATGNVIRWRCVQKTLLEHLRWLFFHRGFQWAVFWHFG